MVETEGQVDLIGRPFRTNATHYLNLHILLWIVILTLVYQRYYIVPFSFTKFFVECLLFRISPVFFEFMFPIYKICIEVYFCYYFIPNNLFCLDWTIRVVGNEPCFLLQSCGLDSRLKSGCNIQ